LEVTARMSVACVIRFEFYALETCHLAFLVTFLCGMGGKSTGSFYLWHLLGCVASNACSSQRT